MAKLVLLLAAVMLLALVAAQDDDDLAVVERAEHVNEALDSDEALVREVRRIPRRTRRPIATPTPRWTVWV